MKLFSYIKDSFNESKHIKWPARSQTIAFTIAVIVLSFAVAYYLHLFDTIFARLLDLII